MIDVELNWQSRPLREDIADYLVAAKQRVDDFYERHEPNDTRGFIPSDYITICQVLRTIKENNLACGAAFCEWGSGLGIVASVAAILGFDSCGIEIDRELFIESQNLAQQFKIPVEFIHGSFVPYEAEELIDVAFQENEGELRLTTFPDDAYQQLGQEIADFDLIFAFPWPNDEALTVRIFESFGSHGALLLTYCEKDSVRLRRK